MSYCRFSCDDYRCNVYAFESDAGIEMYLARRKPVYRAPLPEPFGKSQIADETTSKQWISRYNAVTRMLEMADREEITLPYAGGHFVFDEPGEAADFLLELRALGYRFPGYALKDLKEEQAAIDAKGNPDAP